MNPFETIRSIVTDAHESLETAVADLLPNLANKTQPGTANTLGAIYAHALINLDMFYVGAMQGQPLMLTTSGFADKQGISDPTNLGWEVLNATEWNIPFMQEYAQALYKSINQYLDTLNEEELSRTCKLFDREMSVSQLMTITTWHTALHAGEIAALKGINEIQGLPF